MLAMPPKRAAKKASEKKARKEFIWTDDEAQLLLDVAHDFKLQHLSEGICWESVKSKYSDILDLFRKELPQNEEQARNSSKDYPHKPDEVSKEVLTSKLKAIRIKFREVCGNKPVAYYRAYTCDRCLFTHRLLTLDGEVDTAELYIFIMSSVRNFGAGARQLNRLKWA